jgi:DNA mismatch repair ATPase MutS
MQLDKHTPMMQQWFAHKAAAGAGALLFFRISLTYP